MRLPVYERRAGVSPLSMPQVQANPQVGDNGETAAKTLQGVFTRLEEIQNGMEDARTLELFNRFKMDSQKYHEDPDRGIYNTRLGYHASGIYQEADQWLRRKGEDYARELPSRRAQFNFRKMAREHIQQRGVQNSRFEADQVKKYQQETADATIKERLNYAESHWNDNAAIAEVRRDIQQALELKMRGSGKEAFDAAMMDIEDQIGVARIRQAVVQNPVLGVDMLNNSDVHLKADTRAKLTEYLKNRTEIYRIHGIVQEYAKQYSPENAVEAQKVLIQRYGPEEGQKAFAALARHWGIQRSQDSVREQNLRKQQENNENQMLDKWNDFLTGQSATMPDVTEFTRRARNGEIRREFALSMIGRVISKLEADQKEQAKAEKLRRDTLIFAAESNGQFFSDEELVQMVAGTIITDEEARAHQARRYTHSQRLEQEENKRFEDNRQNFLDRFADGGVTEEIINDAEDNKILKPSDAQTFRNYLRTERERLEAEQRRDTQEAERLKKKAQEEYEGSVRVVVGLGGRISRESAAKLKDADKISQSFMQWLFDQETRHEREEAAAQKEQAKQQAEADKEAWKKNLDSIAQLRAMMYFQNEGEGLRIINSQDFMPELSTEQRKYLREQFNTHSHAINLEAKNHKDQHEEVMKQLHETRLRFYETEINTREEIAQARKNLQDALNQGLDHKFYKQAETILDEKERKLDKAQAEADKKQKEADKLTLAQRIEQWGTDIYEAYKSRGKGEALKYVDRIEINDPETRRKLHARVSTLFDDEGQAAKDQRESVKQASNELYEDMSLDILRRSLSDEEIAQYRKTFLDMRENKQLDEQKYNGLIAILNQQQKANNEAAESKSKADNYKIATDYAEQFGLDRQHEARQKIREEYPDTRANEIMTQFDRLIQEKQEEQNKKDKALRLQQEQNFIDLQNQYWRNSTIIPEQVLRDHEQNKTLTTAQLGQIRAVNAKMTTKDGRREELAKLDAQAWAAMSPREREIKVMQSFGVSEDTRKETVAALFQKAVDGTLTNTEIEDNRADARISDEDAENLRTFDTKFARRQKQLIGTAASQMHNIINELYPKDQRKRLNAWNNAYTDFQLQTLDIDTHDKNFTENLKGIVERIMDKVFSDYEEFYKGNLSERVFPWIGDNSVVPTQAGERLDTAREKVTDSQLPQIAPAIPYSPISGDTQFISPSGVIQDARPVPTIPERQAQQQLEQARSVWQKIQQAFSSDTFGGGYDPSNNAANDNPLMQRYTNPANYNQPRPQNSSEVMQSIAPSVKVSISSGYSEQPTALRDGRAHRAFDWRMPVGTWLYPPRYSNTWRVLQTGENSKAGKFIKLQTTTASGDVDVHTYAHLSSVDVKPGDVISSGDVVAKSGNTGHTTGPHLHWGMQRNGQAVNPTKIDEWNGNSSGDVQGYVPEPIVPPVVSTDEEFEAAALELFGLNPLWSNDIFDSNSNFGRRY